MARVDVGQLVATISVLDDASPALEVLNRHIDETGKQFDTLGQKVEAFVTKSLDLVGRGIDDAGKRADSFGKKLLLLGTAIPAVGIGFAKAATDLNAVVANISALLTEMSGPELTATTTAMKENIRSIAIETGKSTEDVGSALYEIISALGFTADSYDQLRVAARASVAGVSTTAEAFNLLNNVTQAYGDTSAQAFRLVGDLSFQAVNLGKTTYPELAASIGTVIPLAKTMGVSLQELFGLIGALTGITGDTSQVVTQLGSALAGLATPGKELQDMYDKLGTHTAEATVKQYGLAKTLQMVAEVSQKTGKSIIELLGRREAWVATAAIAGAQAQRVAQFQELMAKATIANGKILEDSFAKQAHGVNEVGFVWKQLMVTIKAISQVIGDIFLPIFGVVLGAFLKVAEGVKFVVDLLAKFGNAVRSVIVGVSVMSTAFGSFFMIMGFVAKALLVVIGLTLALVKSVVVFGVLKLGLMAIGAVLGGVIGQWITWSATLLTVRGLLVALGGLFVRLAQSVAGTWVAMQVAQVVGYKLGSALLDWGDKLRGVDDATRQATKNVDFFSGGLALLGDAASGVSRSIGTLFTGLQNALKPGTSAVEKFGAVIVKGVLTPIEVVAKGASLLGDGIKYIGDALYGQIPMIKDSEGAWADWYVQIKKINDEVQNRAAASMAALDALVASGASDPEIRKKLDAAYEKATIQKVRDMGFNVRNLAAAEHILALMAAEAAKQHERLQKQIDALLGKTKPGKVDKDLDRLGKALTDASAAADTEAWDHATKSLDELDKELTDAAHAADTEGWGKWAESLDSADKSMAGIVDESWENQQIADETNMSYSKMADELKDMKVHSEQVRLAMQGVALIAGSMTGKFADILQAVESIGQNFEKDWQVSKFQAIASAIGQIAAAVGGTAGNAIAGAAGGAMTGFAVGGPYGAVIGGVIGGILSLFSSAKKKAEETKKKIQELENSLQSMSDEIGQILDQKIQAGTAGLASMFSYLADSTGLTQERLARMGTIGMAMFDALRKQGYSVVDAMLAMGDALDQATRAAEQQGLALTGSFAELAAFRKLVMDNSALVQAADSLSAVFDMLRSTGSLTQQAYEAMAGELNTYYNELITAGFSSNQALALLAPTLYQIKKAAEEGRIVVDAGTQALIDQADTAGLLSGLEDPMERLIELQQLMLQTVAQLVQLFGGSLPAAVQKYIDTLNKIPGIPAPSVAAPTGGGGVEIPGYQGGIGFRNFGRGTLAVLHGEERVQTRAQAAASDGALLSELRGLRSDLASMPAVMRRAMVAAKSFSR